MTFGGIFHQPPGEIFVWIFHGILEVHDFHMGVGAPSSSSLYRVQGDGVVELIIQLSHTFAGKMLV